MKNNEKDKKDENDSIAKIIRLRKLLIAKTIRLRKKCEGAKIMLKPLSSMMTTKCIANVGGRASEPDK